MNRIQNAFEQGRSKNRACFVSYICAGDPDFDTSLEVARTLIETGTDILELGVPFSDPLADGLTNQLAAERALASGMTHARVLEFVREIRKFSQVPIVFYTYYNLVYRNGLDIYARQAKEAGVDGILILDLPPEEAEEWLVEATKADIKTVFILSPTTPRERMSLIANVTTGFLYYVSREGVTGERTDLVEGLSEKVAMIRKETDNPLVVGFGVSLPEHVGTISKFADGVVVGSALVNCIYRNLDNPQKALEELREKSSALVAGLDLA